MGWEAIGAVGEDMGAVGVILTLAYLSIQIRQNTRSTRAATVQAIAQFENIHCQFEQGVLDRDIFERHCRAMDYYMAAPGGIAWWNTWSERFSPSFVAFLESRRSR